MTHRSTTRGLILGAVSYTHLDVYKRQTQTPTLDGPDVVEVQARGDEGEYLIFRASDQAMTIQGESACVASAEG